MITIEDATEHDIFEFIHSAREMDKEEVRRATNGKNIVDALRVWKDYNTKAVKCDGELIGIGGIEEEDTDNCASVWLLLTNNVINHKVEFLRWSKGYRDKLLDKYSYIYNYIYMGNELHVKYLQWLGAHFHVYNTGSAGEWAYFIIRKE